MQVAALRVQEVARVTKGGFDSPTLTDNNESDLCDASGRSSTAQKFVRANGRKHGCAGPISIDGGNVLFRV